MKQKGHETNLSQRVSELFPVKIQTCLCFWPGRVGRVYSTRYFSKSKQDETVDESVLFQWLFVPRA